MARTNSSTSLPMPPAGRRTPARSAGAADRSLRARLDRMMLGSPLRAAASSWGTAAARLSWSVSPALMPPTSGSTSRSTTSSPSRRGGTAPIATSVRSIAGSDGRGRQVEVAAARSPRRRGRRSRCRPARRGRSARRARCPRAAAGARLGSRRGPARAAGETSSPSRPSSRHSSMRPGTRARKASARLVERPAGERRRADLAPRADPARSP